jgi:hypothetical protein
MVNMHGMHAMSATMTAADPKTGIVDVMAGGMALSRHFPAKSAESLKVGGKIGRYMAYSLAASVKWPIESCRRAGISLFTCSCRLPCVVFGPHALFA